MSKVCKATWEATEDYPAGKCDREVTGRTECRGHSWQRLNHGFYKPLRPPAQDLTGRKFGRLTVLKLDGCYNRHRYWQCLCECGTYKVATTCNLNSGSTTSCGCYATEVIRKHHRARVSYRCDDPDGWRTCANCRELLPVGFFRTDDRALDGLGSWCYHCHAGFNYKVTGPWIRERITRGCGLCGAVMDMTQKRAYAVDHDHRCCPGGKSCGQCVRDIICHLCNMAGLAWYESARGTIQPIELFERYLQKYETPEQTLAAGVDRLPETEKDAA